MRGSVPPKMQNECQYEKLNAKTQRRKEAKAQRFLTQSHNDSETQSVSLFFVSLIIGFVGTEFLLESGDMFV